MDGFRSWLCIAVLVLGAASCALGGEEPAAPQPDAVGRSTAVALNYCRASFHRIKRYPSKWVLLEEQEKILNNLNLNEIADEELIKLYTAVLCEINGVRIADQERQIMQERYVRTFVRQAAVDAFVLSSQLAAQDYVAAVKQGAKSWWDYRTMAWNRDLDMWQIDKQRMQAFVDKSSQFLDTFWKLARRRNIPDHWLVRDDDLDRLERALQEPDLEVRLRILRRMERFMECYPPYWYYVGRTEQGLGRLEAAIGTFEKLVELGQGHFRKDDMLAAATANRAAMEDCLGRPQAEATAEEALLYSTSVWEANLLAAQVLARHGRFRAAEDAILRNIDVDLEREQSLVALTLLYSRWGKEGKVLEKLNDPAVVKLLPMPAILSCAEHLGGSKLPATTMAYLENSLSADVEIRFGRDNLVFYGAAAWRLDQARPTLYMLDHRCVQPPQIKTVEFQELRYEGVLEAGSPLKSGTVPTTLTLALDYPGMRVIHVHMQRGTASTGLNPLGATAAFVTATYRPAAAAASATAFRIAAIDVGKTRLVFGDASAFPPPYVQEGDAVDDVPVTMPAIAPAPTPVQDPAPAPRPVQESGAAPSPSPADGESPAPAASQPASGGAPGAEGAAPPPSGAEQGKAEEPRTESVEGPALPPLAP